MCLLLAKILLTIIRNKFYDTNYVILFLDHPIKSIVFDRSIKSSNFKNVSKYLNRNIKILFLISYINEFGISILKIDLDICGYRFLQMRHCSYPLVVKIDCSSHCNYYLFYWLNICWGHDGTQSTLKNAFYQQVQSRYDVHRSCKWHVYWS